MDFLTNVNAKIEENKAEMISSLSTLLSIPSVATEDAGEAHFGEDVQRAYKHAMNMAEDAGFRTFNADNYGGHIDYTAGPNDNGEIVGIIGHLDVVPAGNDWDFEPYGGQVIDGNICGRGATDDKGPVVAAFYAMKALKECGFEPKRTIRMILGLDEETNWQGMDYYLENVDKLPDYGFTPDADFPAIHGEKGILIFDIAKKFNISSDKGLELSSIKGGTVANAVADYARAVLHESSGAGYDSVKNAVVLFRESKGCKINCRGIGKSLEVTISGKAAHGAQPDKGLNAISLIMEFLGGLNFANDDVNDFIGFYNNCIGFDIHGERIGCDFEDEPSGKLIFNVGKIELDKKSVELTINIRYPVTFNDSQVYNGIMSVLDKYALGIVKDSHQLPIYVAKGDPLVETLVSVYRNHTNDMESEPQVIGGGTYARAMDNIIAFGAHFPGEPELEHQKNELISIDNMMKLTKIYAEAIYRLAEM